MLDFDSPVRASFSPAPRSTFNSNRRLMLEMISGIESIIEAGRHGEAKTMRQSKTSCTSWHDSINIEWTELNTFNLQMYVRSLEKQKT